MKKTLYLLIVLLLAGCSNNSKTDDQTLTEQIKPKCQLIESEPCVSSSCIKLHAVCSGGNMLIEEAYITLDTQHKSVAFEGTSLDTFVSFENLQPNTTYQAELTVLVSGEMIKESKTVGTRDAELVCKNSLDLYIRSLTLPSDGTILDLNSLCILNGVIAYKIKSINFTEGSLLYPDVSTYNLADELRIDGNKLKLSDMPLGGGDGVIVIQAVALGATTNIMINLGLESLYLP